MYSFPNLKPVHCSMSSSNCCFLTCIQTSQEAGQVVWYSQLFKNFPQFVVIHTVKGLGIVNKAKVDVFLKLSCFFYDPTDIYSMLKNKNYHNLFELFFIFCTKHQLSLIVQLFIKTFPSYISFKKNK